MIKNKYVRKMAAVTMTVVCMLSSVISAYAIKKVEPTTEFGTVSAENTTGRDRGEKIVFLSLSSTKKANMYNIRYNVTYAGYGTSISGDVQLVNCNMWEPMKSFENVEMHHWRNERTGQYDGFMDTRITTYSTHEVRGIGAYAIYLCSTL